MLRVLEKKTNTPPVESGQGKISEQLNSAQCSKQTRGEESDNVGRRQVAADEQQHQPMPSAVCGSFSELQAEFRVIRDSVAKLKLPPDLVVGDSRAGVSRGDLPKFNIIQKSARYQETVLKLLSTCDPADAAVNQISAVSLAHLRFLQEEYMQLLVSSQFDDGTAKLFCTLQQNPATFTPNSLENLQRAVSIAGARQYHQVSSSRGRAFFPAWRGSRGPGREFQYSPRRGGGQGLQPADWGRPRSPFDLDLSRVSGYGRGSAGRGAARRFKRRILSFSRAPGLQKIPPVCLQRTLVCLESTSIWLGELTLLF